MDKAIGYNLLFTSQGSRINPSCDSVFVRLEGAEFKTKHKSEAWIPAGIVVSRGCRRAGAKKSCCPFLCTMGARSTPPTPFTSVFGSLTYLYLKLTDLPKHVMEAHDGGLLIHLSKNIATHLTLHSSCRSKVHGSRNMMLHVCSRINFRAWCSTFHCTGVFAANCSIWVQQGRR